VKRFASIFLLTFYLITSVGVNVSLHYCGGSLADVSVSQNALDTQCACGSEMMEDDCCQTKSLHVEIKDKNHQASTFSFNNTLTAKGWALPIAIINFNSAIAYEMDNLIKVEQPPHLSKVPLRIKNQVFRV